MNWLSDLFSGDTIPGAILILSSVTVLGLAIGRIRFFGISLGIAGVLFSGLIFGHFGFSVNSDVLSFALEFGLILFVYTIGIQIGPSFFASFKKQGLKLNILAASNVFMGALLASVLLILTGLHVEVIVGIMSGAVTNTPGLGAATEVLSDIHHDSPEILQMPGLGYAMAYPFGIIGIILVMLLIKKLFNVNLTVEKKKFEHEQSRITGSPENHNFIVTNKNLDGKTVADLNDIIEGNFVVSRIYRDEGILNPDKNTVINLGDMLHIVCRAELIEDLSVMIGDFSELDIRKIDSDILVSDIFITSKSAQRKNIGELQEFYRRVNFTRVERSGIEFVAGADMQLQFADRLTVVGDRKSIDKVKQFLGDSGKDLQVPRILPIFIGMVLGIFVGSIPIPVPGLPVPVKLGLAGGPLLVALILGRLRKIGPINWYLPHSSNLVLREVGITLFLACVGLKSGDRFLETLISGEGFYWMFLGFLITLIPLLITGFTAKYFFRENYLSVCGLLSGSCTDPPALSFANQVTDSEGPSLTYATVYALTMFLRIFCAQLIVLIFA